MKTRSLLFVCALVALSIAAVASAGPDSAPLPAAPDTSSWQALPAPGGHPIQALATSPAFLDDQTLFAATSGGIYRSNDAGQSWTLLGMGPTGIISDTTKIVPSPAYPADGTLFVITRFVAPEPPSPKSQRVMDGALFGITQAAESVDGRVLRSTDAGATWQAVWASAVVHDLVVSPNYAVDGTLFFSAATAPYGRPQIYRSTDRGDNWLPTANQPGEGDDTYLDPYLLAISPDYGADQTLFAAGYGAIHRSTDGGATWQGLRVTGPNYSVALSPHFATDRTIWAMYREVEASVMQPEAGIVRSTDGGATWRNVTAGLDGNYNQNYRSLAPDPTGQVVYLALAGPEWSEHFPPRVYRSDNAGLSWAPQALLPGGAAPRQVLAPGPLPHLFALADGVAYRYNSTCYEILADGGFETDPELLAYGITPAWEIPGTAHPAVYTMDLKLAGGWAMRSGIWPGDPNVLSYSDFRQRINIPADATSAVLRFWRYPIFGDSAAAGAVSVPAGGWLAAGPDAPDYQYVLARFDDDGYEMLSTWRDNDHSWLETEINLLGQRGKNFRVQWGVFNNGIDGTSAMFVDEASVTICRPAMSGKVAVYLPMLLYDPGIPMMPTLTPTPTPSLTPSPSSTPTRTPTVTITPTPTSTWTFPTTLRELIVAPGAPGPLYALTNSQLLLVSYDRGESWQAAPQGVPVAVGRAGLGMDYANPSTLYLGTQAGLFRTDANGQWQFLHTVRTHALSVEYNRLTTLWAAPNIGHDFGSGVMVIKSDDGGQIWRSASDGLQGWTAANPIIIDPDDPNTLYISTATKYGSGVLHRGTNAGNWRWLPGPTFGWNVNTGLAFDNGANALYMGSRYLGQLWRSLNANTPAPEDVTWQLVHDFGANTSVVPLAVGWGPAGAAIYINLTDTTDWSTQLLRSDDDGATWRPLNLPPGPPPPPSNQYQLIVNGYPAVRQIADYRSQDRYATSFAGLHRKIGYNDWTLVNNAAPRPKFVYSPANSSLIWAGLTQMCLAGGPDEPMYKSDDGGRTWRELPGGLNIQPVVAHPTDPLRVYGFGCDGVYLTSDGGATWQRQASDLWLTYFVSDIAAVDPAWTTVYASGISEGGGGMLARSTDGGATWQRVTPLYEDIWWITDVWVDPANANRVYFVEPKGVWRSLDAGATWQRFTAGLEDILYEDGRQPYGLTEIVSDLSDPSRLYLGTAAGLYESSNFGANWQKLSGYSWDSQPVDGLLADGSNGVWLNSPDGAFYLYFGYPPASPTPTPTATTVAGCWEGFVNGGFETDAGWTIRSNPVLAGYVTSPVHSGSRSMRTGIPAGGANVASYSPVEQSVSFPAGVTSATLSFWRYNVNGDVGAAAAGWQPDPTLLPRTEAAQAGNIQAADYFYVLAILPNGTIDYLFTETANAPSWRSRAITLNVSRYAGKTIRFQFGTYNNGTGGISRTFVDDVALTLCSAAITATPTATRTPTPTATRTATPTPTRTATPTATATSVAGCWEGFVNGGFETNAGWTIRSNPVLAGYVTAPVRSGSRSMRTGIPAGGANVASYSPVEQSVSFPAGVTSATLSFWRYNVNGDVGAAAAAWQPDPALLPRTEAAQAGNIQAADYFYVLAILPNGTIDYLFTEAVNAPSWRSRAITLNASRYAGKTIRFQFGTYNNGTGGISRTFVDDAALTLCSTGVGASPTPTATATGVPATIPTAAPGYVATPHWAGRLNLPAGSRPHGLVVSEDGKRVYVAFHGIDHTGRTLGVINEYLSLQAQIDLGPEAQGPNGVALIPSNGRVVVANRQTANATLVDVADGVVLGHVAANTMPDGVIVHGGYGYIANYGNDTVTVFDPATLTVLRTLHGVGHEPALFAADSMSNDVYLSAHGSNQVFVLRDGQVGAHWDGIPEPYGLSYDAASRRLYVANRGAHHTVTVLDIYHDWVVGTIPVAKEAFVLFVNPESGHLFVACGDEVKIYDTYDWSLVTSIPVPAGAEEGIAFDARLSKVFVTSRDSDALTVIQDLGPGRVVFASSRDGNSEIYRMLPDGRQQQRLTFTADASENAPVGSLDGRWIAYERTDAGSPTYTQIWLMSRDGRGATMLTDGPFNNLHPTWSADSRKLALASDRDGDWEIYTLDLATLGLTKLTDNTWFDGQPDWSKPAGRIAFVSNRNTPNGEIFTMAADGSDVRQLTASVNGDASPSWEPGGNRLVFWGSRPEGQGLYMTHSDGSDVRLLVPQALLPSWPTWGLLGDTIVFSGYRPGNGYSEIMRIEVDGSGLVLLTNNELDFDYAPGYLPGY